MTEKIKKYKKLELNDSSTVKTSWDYKYYIVLELPEQNTKRNTGVIPFVVRPVL